MSVYDEALGASWQIEDLKHVARVADRLAVASEGLHVELSEVLVWSDQGDYIIGVLWWDSETEQLMLDPRRWGESPVRGDRVSGPGVPLS